MLGSLWKLQLFRVLRGLHGLGREEAAIIRVERLDHDWRALGRVWVGLQGGGLQVVVAEVSVELPRGDQVVEGRLFRRFFLLVVLIEVDGIIVLAF